MPAKILRIDPDVLQVLERCDTDGNQLELAEQLDRKLYVKVAKALEAIGARWSKYEKRHIFPPGVDAAAALDALVVSGEIQLPDSFDFFRTPLDVVAQLVDRAEIDRDHVVGEFSAGDGAIAKFLQPLTDRPVETCEIRADNCKLLRMAGFNPRHADFLSLTPRPICDRIVINPPFSKSQEARHVLHALQFLKPGGRLVSVMSNAITFRQTQVYQQLRELLERRGARIDRLPEGAFRESGTMVATCIVTVDADGLVATAEKVHAPIGSGSGRPPARRNDTHDLFAG